MFHISSLELTLDNGTVVNCTPWDTVWNKYDIYCDFLDKDGNEIRSANRIMGTPVSVETLPAHVWQAIVAIEDKRFFEHGPIDIRGITRAVFSNLASKRVAAGGSTITQQTAKNIFLSRDKKISRKVQELILSHWLENRFTKNQVLDLYMNLEKRLELDLS